MITEEVKSEVAKYRWYHNIDLGNASVSAARWREIQCPPDLEYPLGYRVLDVAHSQTNRVDVTEILMQPCSDS